MIAITRALLSCADKTGLDRLAKALAKQGVELVASGGTADYLAKQGLQVTSVEAFAGIPEQLDGRVKTLHPKIHAGILARRDDPAHVQAVGPQGLIDLVIVNLYPFESTVARPGAAKAEAIEQIDIGGVALLRAAAKNASGVAAVSQPSQYERVIAALDRGRLPEALAGELAVEAFRLTSAYDAAIAGYLAGCNSLPAGQASGVAALPPQASVTIEQRMPLRYGENPHQQGAWYAPPHTAEGLAALKQLQGKTLSYNNLMDIDAAVRGVLEFPGPACAIIKHASLCGLAAGASAGAAYERALACDPESAFGGIVGFNREVDEAAATQLIATFLEVIVAPSVAPAALTVFAKKAKLRVITLAWPSQPPAGLEWRPLLGGWLVQQPDLPLLNGDPKIVTTRAPTEAQRRDLLFAWRAAKLVRSNGIVFALHEATVGIGQGQPSRVGSVRLAIEKAGARANGAVAASDGFFPFPDSVDLLAEAGVTAVIQPGGSVKDAEVVAAADRLGIAMLLTGIRHFRH